MSEGYNPDEEDAAFSGLDEYLCEYVDGTMDPAVRRAFEEYLRANPDLLAHVACLCRTRQLLCRYGCRHAPSGFQARLRRRLACEMMQTQLPTLPALVTRLGAFATWTSVMIVMLIMGIMAGATLQTEAPPVLTDRMAIPLPTRPAWQDTQAPATTYAGLLPAYRPYFHRPDTAHHPPALQRLRATP